MLTTVRGLVLREVDYRDSDKMLTILTAERGKLSAVARRARSKSSRTKAGTQMLTCSDFTLFEQGGRYSVDVADPVDMFIGLRSDIVALSLGAYIAEVLEAVAGEGIQSGALLSDGLNALYALSKKLRPHELVKAAFEFRAAALAGFAPDMSECAICGASEPESPALNIADGELVCVGCFGDALRLDRASLVATRYLMTADSKKMLGFSLDGGSLELLSQAAERYLLTHLDRGFSTLDFYKAL